MAHVARSGGLISGSSVAELDFDDRAAIKAGDVQRGSPRRATGDPAAVNEEADGPQLPSRPSAIATAAETKHDLISQTDPFAGHQRYRRGFAGDRSPRAFRPPGSAPPNPPVDPCSGVASWSWAASMNGRGGFPAGAATAATWAPCRPGPGPGRWSRRGELPGGLRQSRGVSVLGVGSSASNPFPFRNLRAGSADRGRPRPEFRGCSTGV